MPAPSNVLPGQPGTGGSNTPWGLVPQVPDPIATANAAITGDLANFPQLSQLANQVNTFNTQQAIAPYIANLPGYSQMVEQSSSNIGNLLAGQIPQDVMNLIGQQAAERGVNQGISGSPNQNAELLRALGLTSLGLQQQGEGELTAAIGRTPVPQLFNTAQFLTTPGDEQAAQMAANIYAAAPNPGMQAQALIDLFTKFMSQLGQGGRGPSLVTPGGGFGQGTYSGAGNNVGATGGGGGQLAGGPGLSLNTGRMFPGGTSVSYGGAGGGGGFSQGPTLANAAGAGSGWNLGGTSTGTGSFMDTLFGSPGYGDSQILGMGLDPGLNALFGSAPANQWNLGGTSPGGGSFQNTLFGGTGYGDTGILGAGLDPGLNALFGQTGTGQSPPPATQSTFYDFLTGGQTPYIPPSGPTYGDSMIVYPGESMLPGESPSDFYWAPPP